MLRLLLQACHKRDTGSGVGHVEFVNDVATSDRCLSEYTRVPLAASFHQYSILAYLSHTLYNLNS
jgi:hypothetical protein